ncbi:S46 family peptidase [Calditrichota bacterium]
MLKRQWINPFILFALILIQSTGIADEGMWMPHQMKMLNLQQQGLEMNPDELYKPDGSGLMSAVVDLSSGTGSFVSKDGLILTNHHVAFGAIQMASDPEHNYLEDGFLAKTKEEEIQAPGYTAGVLISYQDVTDQIHTQLNEDMSALERFEAIDHAKKTLIKKAESKGPDVYAEVASMYSGNQYYLFIYKKLKDIRIVYAPPTRSGKFRWRS